MATDWKGIGLKVGIEIHQQLEGKKLFCSCPTRIRDDEPKGTVKRKLRTAAGESGDIDIAAKREAEKGKTFTYQEYDTTCLVELDEEPPHPINKESLKTALQFAKLVDANPVDQVRVMRKTVVDGSNTSGFQRTALIATGGRIKTSQGTVRIATICLEEDAARIINSDATTTTYRLDRLGIPLIEVATHPDITTPEQAKEAAETIGLLLRATGKAKRGLGTIRQDVNISTKGGPRIEIKGAQELETLPLLVQNEAERQQRLLLTATELRKKGAVVGGTIQDVTQTLKESTSKIVTNTLAKNGKILGINLHGYKGLIGPTKLGKELAGRAKAYAGVGGLVHTDELPAYGITKEETEAVAKALKCRPEDAFVIVADAPEKAKHAMNAIIERAREALDGVPKEVRKANEDATSTFLRPMPGAARMYPETDVPPITIDEDGFAAIPLPETIESKQKRYEKIGLAKDLAELTARSDRAALFDKFVKEFPKLKPAYIAEIVMTADKTIKRQFNIEIAPSEDDYATIFKALDEGALSKESVLDLLKEKKPAKEAIGKYRTMGDEELTRALEKIIRDNEGLQYNALIGKAMAQLRGKASGQKIAEIVKRLSERKQ